ncbi:hypothetical protein FRC07_004136 [Ceratobasidium sp. 392]|nr:hypothetical protein FRC07_004136 [Ceratobasidium sp. 392]
MNKDEDDAPVEEAAEGCREALNFHQGRFAGKRTAANQPDQPSLEDILKEAAAPPKEPEIPPEDELFQGGKPAEPWKDIDEPEPIEGITIREVRSALMRIVVGPVLFERGCKANLAKNGGKLVCSKCRQLDPEAEPNVFASESNLRGHIRNIHTEWNDLALDMKYEGRFKCPGVCGTSKQFEDVEQVREHCLSTDCKDQKGFLAMKAIHDAAAKRRSEARKKEPAEQGGAVHARKRGQIRKQQLQYYGSLTLEDIFRLANRFKIPRDEVEPYAERMVKIFHFMSEALLE